MVVALLSVFGLLIPGLGLVVLVLREEYFSIRALSLVIYLIEAFPGYVKIIFNESSEYSIYDVNALIVYGAAIYLIFLGYSLSRHITLIRASTKATQAVFVNNRSFLILWFLTLLATLATLPILIAKAEAAGGWDNLITNLYHFRYGTFNEDTQSNAWNVLSGLYGTLSGALILLLYGTYTKVRAQGFKLLFFVLAVCLVLVTFMALNRSSFIFLILSILGFKHSISPFSRTKMRAAIFALFLSIMPLNYAHQYLYFLTAGWDEPTFIGSLEALQGPQGHIQTLTTILRVSAYAEPLHEEAFAESILFFVPRFFWTSKADIYGTTLVQEWARLPTHYQMAPTTGGELLAHFGYLGITLSILVGILFGWFDKLKHGNEVNRAAFYGLLLPRTLVNLGMGVSAISITIFQYLLFLGVTSMANALSRVKVKVRH